MGRKHRKWAKVQVGQDNPVDYAISSRDQSVVDMVDAAVQHDQVMLAFQPIVTATGTGFPAFYEGLIRVLDETGRIIPAKDFIDQIETRETGRIIDCLALERGLRALKTYPDLRLSINMSARSIGYARWNRALKRGIGRDPTIAERLILEITESSAIMVPELVVSFMNELQTKGVSFALDDFGAGFTSFRYLKDFYFDIMKIDGQFIRGIAENSDNQVLTGAMIGIARQLDMVSVAENVERAADAEYLARNGVDCLQGYYFGAPSIHPPWENATQQSASA